MNLLQRVKGWIGSEGSSRPVRGVGELGGVFDLGSWADGYQQNLTIGSFEARHIPAAYAAVMANGRGVSQSKPAHKRKLPGGGYEVVETSAAARLFRNPNIYETWSQFILNMVAMMQFDGEAFALAIRNNKNEIVSLIRQPSNTVQPYIDPESGALFYGIGDDGFVSSGIGAANAMVPGRDVLHLRAHCPRHPMIGESPVKAAAMAAGINVALSNSQQTFFKQMSRPSGVISTDVFLNREQLTTLREAWKAQSQGISQGEIPILSGGMKFNAMGISSQDAQLIEAQRMSIEEIARVFGVPLPVIGDLTNSTLTNVEQMVSMWLSISLGALIENIESSLEKLLAFGPADSVVFDVGQLLRTDFAGRVEGLTKGVQGGLYTPNEARARENLPPVEHGDDAYMQQQMVPLGYEPPAPVAPAPADEPEDEPEDDPGEVAAREYNKGFLQ